MAIHGQRFTEYQSYPGRQVEYTVVPRRYQHYFFEGIQSVDATANSDDVQHGQFGFKSDVIIDKDYSNTTGTVSLKEFNNASYVLRGMTGADPATSFVFDPSRLEHVDVCANLYNKARNKVIRSTWLVDFMPSLSENESLDDIQTRDISYTAVRKIDFEGYQIVHQEWLDPDDETYGANKAGAQDFLLQYPAVIDPVVAYAEIDDTSTDSTTAGQIIGKGRHELCPIQFMLRVIVNGEVLDDPTQATVTTTVTGGQIVQSRLHLTTPLPEDGTPVVAFWLADGNNPHGSRALTTAPVMTDITVGVTTTSVDPDPQFTKANYTAGTGWNINPFDDGMGGGGPVWDGTLILNWSAALAKSAVNGLHFTTGSGFDNFNVKVVIIDNSSGTSTTYNLGSPDLIGESSPTAQFSTLLGGALISRNKLTMQFTSLPPISLPSLDSTIEWYISYQAVAGVMPLHGDDSKEVTPMHTIRVRTQEGITSRVY